MADMEFDLGEALGGYEQAQADRNFYLSMVQGGTQAASPIAAYLAGVSGVKMANMRQQVQDVQDARQAKLDATESADKAQKREQGLQNQVINIMKGARDGSLAPGAAAAMLGKIAPELGFQMVSYDADNQIAQVRSMRDGQDYQWDLGEQESQLEEGRNKRASQRIEWEREKQQAGIEGQIRVANAKKAASSGAGKEARTTLTGFKSAHDKVLRAVGKEALVKMLDYGQVKDFIEGLEGLSQADRIQMQGKADSILKAVQKAHPSWTLSSPVSQLQAGSNNKNVKVF